MALSTVISWSFLTYSLEGMRSTCETFMSPISEVMNLDQLLTDATLALASISITSARLLCSRRNRPRQCRRDHHSGTYTRSSEHHRIISSFIVQTLKDFYKFVYVFVITPSCDYVLPSTPLASLAVPFSCLRRTWWGSVRKNVRRFDLSREAWLRNKWRWRVRRQPGNPGKN